MLRASSADAQRVRVHPPTYERLWVLPSTVVILSCMDLLLTFSME